MCPAALHYPHSLPKPSQANPSHIWLVPLMAPKNDGTPILTFLGNTNTRVRWRHVSSCSTLPSLINEAKPSHVWFEPLMALNNITPTFMLLGNTSDADAAQSVGENQRSTLRAPQRLRTKECGCRQHTDIIIYIYIYIHKMSQKQ